MNFTYGWSCLHCGYGAPKFWSKVSTGGWILVCLLLLSCVGTPFFWLGLLFKTGGKLCPCCCSRYA